MIGGAAATVDKAVNLVDIDAFSQSNVFDGFGIFRNDANWFGDCFCSDWMVACYHNYLNHISLFWNKMFRYFYSTMTILYFTKIAWTFGKKPTVLSKRSNVRSAAFLGHYAPSCPLQFHEQVSHDQLLHNIFSPPGYESYWALKLLTPF